MSGSTLKQCTDLLYTMHGMPHTYIHLRQPQAATGALLASTCSHSTTRYPNTRHELSPHNHIARFAVAYAFGSLLNTRHMCIPTDVFEQYTTHAGTHTLRHTTNHGLHSAHLSSLRTPPAAARTPSGTCSRTRESSLSAAASCNNPAHPTP